MNRKFIKFSCFLLVAVVNTQLG